MPPNWLHTSLNALMMSTPENVHVALSSTSVVGLKLVLKVSIMPSWSYITLCSLPNIVERMPVYAQSVCLISLPTESRVVSRQGVCANSIIGCWNSGLY